MKVIIFVIICAILFPWFIGEFVSNDTERLYASLGYIIKYGPGAVVGIVAYLIYNELVVQEQTKEELIELRKSVSNTEKIIKK